jgi:hypothetical protein
MASAMRYVIFELAHLYYAMTDAASTIKAADKAREVLKLWFFSRSFQSLSTSLCIYAVLRYLQFPDIFEQFF